MNVLTFINKSNNEMQYIYDITYDNAGYPRFLVYKVDEDGKNGQWVRMSAKHFRPCTAEDWTREFGDARTTLEFASYDC